MGGPGKVVEGDKERRGGRKGKKGKERGREGNENPFHCKSMLTAPNQTPNFLSRFATLLKCNS